MGYSTKYTLSFFKGFEDEVEVNENLSSISGYDLDFFYGEPDCKWYDHEKHMKLLSQIYPETTFLLEGEGEESGDIWRKYFKNGKMQVCKAKIVFPAFDESKLV